MLDTPLGRPGLKPGRLKGCSGRDLNPDALRHMHLKHACLPFHHLSVGGGEKRGRKGGAQEKKGFDHACQSGNGDKRVAAMSPDPEPENSPLDLSSLGFGPAWATGPAETVRAGGGGGGGGRGARDDRDRGPRRDGPSGPRRDGPGGPRRDGPGGPRRDARYEERGRGQERPEPPRLAVACEFYPDDAKFEVLGKAMRESQVTYELFDVAKLILDKEDRLSVVAKHLDPKAHLWLSIPDGIPFLSEAEAVSHVASRHLASFFDTVEVEVEPPKGIFQMVGRCPRTGEVLGAPNHHDWTRRLREHHARHFAGMPFERFKSSVEMVREPEAVAAWVASLSKELRYAPKDRKEGEPEQLDSLDTAKAFLLAHRREAAVRELPWVRFPGRLLPELPAGALRDSALWILEEQRHFPLSTANGIRGRLRKEGFHLYRRGSKGITYVCGVRRRCRDERTTFSEGMARILAELDARPGMNAGQLAAKVLPEGADDAARKTFAEGIIFLVGQGYVAKLANGTLHAQPVIRNAAEAKAAEAEESTAEQAGPEGGEAAGGGEASA